ncbi:MAG TPA: O-antigen ligase family protein [Kofleriaceae bacterium]|nr:O-antigen ligase family protein [Kofleriaceae bacterium]
MIRLALYFYVFLLPFAYLWEVMFGFMSQLKPYRLAGIVLIGLFSVAWAGGKMRVRLDRYDKTYLFFLGLSVVLALLWNLMEGANISGIPHMVIVFLSAVVPYLVIKNMGLSAVDAEKLLRVFVIGVCVSMVVALAAGTSMIDGRLVAFLDNPNRLAFALAVSLHTLIGQIIFGRRRARLSSYVFRGALVIGLAISLIFTGSRAAIVATVASFVIYSIPLLHRRGSARASRFGRAAAFVPIMVIAGGILYSVYDTYQAHSAAIRRYEVGDSGYSGRLDIWRGAWAVSVDHYFIGVGTSQYRMYHRKYMAKLDKLYDSKVADKDLVVHSDYFEMLTSAGALGLILFISMLVSIYRRLSRSARSLERRESALPAIVLPLFVLVLTFGVFHTQVYDPQYFFLMALVTLSARGFSRQSVPQRSTMGRLRQPLSAST